MIKVNNVEVMFEQFPNGETRILTESLPKNGWAIKNILFKYENDSDLIKLLLVKRHLDNLVAKSINYISNATKLIIAYMPYSRNDRSENNSPFTLKYIADFINSLGFERVEVIEPHSDVTCALVNNSTPIYATIELLDTVLEDMNFDKDIDYLYFPDSGASKRYQNLKGFKQLVGHKRRDFQTGEIKSLQVIGDIVLTPKLTRHPNVLQIDDLSSYGGTFVHGSKALRGLGFNEVNLLVAHAENSIFKGELFNHINKLYTTDSILTEQNDWQNVKYKEQLKIFKLEEVL